jgi:CheY-like chemotaxis protein
MNNTVSKPAVDIELVGFNPHDRTLLTSLFRVSNFGTHCYQAWQQDQKSQPDCILLDGDDGDGTHGAGRPSGSPAVTVKAKVTEKSPMVMHVHRPFRWTEILQTLDTIYRPHHDSVRGKLDLSSARQSSSDDSAGLVATRKTSKLFKTVPAVLVINPYPVGWRHITAKLASSGYRVDHVSSGERALCLLKEYRYNGVILETQLPDMNGFEICKLIKESGDRRLTTAIIVTTSRNPLDRLRGDEVGCDAFLSKPVDPVELESVFQKYLPDCRTA